MSRETSGSKRPFSDRDRQQGNDKTSERLCPLRTRCEAGKNAECELAHTRSEQAFWLAEAKKEKAEKAAAKAIKKAAKLLTAPPGPPPGPPPLLEAAVQQAQQDNASVPPVGGIETVTPDEVAAILNAGLGDDDDAPSYSPWPARNEDDPQYSPGEAEDDEDLEGNKADVYDEQNIGWGS